jgi:hypothetical protein
MPTPIVDTTGQIVETVGLMSPTTALLFGLLIGLALGVGGMFALRRKGIVLKKQDDGPQGG